MKKCPYCAEEIQDEVIVCRYCGRDLQAPAMPQLVVTPPNPVQQTAKPPGKKQSGLLTGVSIIIVICCALLFTRAIATSNPRVTPAATTLSEGENGVAISALTAMPTNTPTRTPRPRPTLTPVPTPIFLSSAGDSVFDIQKWKGPAILKIKYTGGGNFAVRNYPANSNGNDYYDLLVNTIGPYEGTLPLDFKKGEQTARLEIVADTSGGWEFRIEPITNARVEQIPGTISGTGDDVVFLKGAMPDLLKADASQAKHNFAVWAITPPRIELVINEIAPYSGTNILNSSTFGLIVHATGPWSIEVATK